VRVTGPQSLLQETQPELTLQIVGFFVAQAGPSVTPPTTSPRFWPSRLLRVSRFRLIFLTFFFKVTSWSSDTPATIAETWYFRLVQSSQYTRLSEKYCST
jgi:hypothetical protein